MPRRRLQMFVFGLVAGIAGGAIVLLDAMANYENKLFDQIVAGTIKPDWNEKQKLVALTAATHDLLYSRRLVFFNKGYVGFRDRWFLSGDVNLLDARGACGSHSGVLGRLLDRAGPLYNLVFPISYEEVGRNWETYKALAPPDYDPQYDYVAVRYTNWEKIPVVLPAIKRALDVLAPEFVRTLSVRAYLLNLYRVYELALIALALAGVSLLLVYRHFARVKAAPEASPPLPA